MRGQRWEWTVATLIAGALFVAIAEAFLWYWRLKT